MGISFPADVIGKIEMEHPNNLIDTFSGVIELALPDEVDEMQQQRRRSASPTLRTINVRAAIQPNNIILRGCVLRNTDWMVILLFFRTYLCLWKR